MMGRACCVAQAGIWQAWSTMAGSSTRMWWENWLYLQNRVSGTTALHDLAEDIHRKRNVADCHPEVVRQGVRAMHETEA